MMKKIGSKAFREGFVAGFTAPCHVFSLPVARTYKSHDLVAESWAELGDLMRSALAEAQNDKAARKSNKGGDRHQAA